MAREATGAAALCGAIAITFLAGNPASACGAHAAATIAPCGQTAHWPAPSYAWPAPAYDWPAPAYTDYAYGNYTYPAPGQVPPAHIPAPVVTTQWHVPQVAAVPPCARRAPCAGHGGRHVVRHDDFFIPLVYVGPSS